MPETAAATTARRSQTSIALVGALVAALAVPLRMPAPADAAGVWTEQARVSPDLGTNYGGAVAVDMNTAFVRSTTGSFSVAPIEVLDRAPDGTWTARTDPLTSAGSAVDADDGVVAVGDPRTTSSLPGGVVRLHEQTGDGDWPRVQTVQGGDTTSGDEFGRAVAVSADLLVVGARSEDTAGLDAGAAYVFRRDGGAWTQQGKLVAPDAADGDWFGAAVAVDAATGLVVVGAPRHDDPERAEFGVDRGAVYVARPEADGSYASVVRVPTPNDIATMHVNRPAEFGSAVATSHGVLAVGTGWLDSLNVVSVLVDSAGTWELHSFLRPSWRGDWPSFGSVLDWEGDVLVAGAPYSNSAGFQSGTAYAYEWDPEAEVWLESLDTDYGTWSGSELVVAGLTQYDHAGVAVAVDRETALVGANRFQPVPDGSERGGAFAFVAEGWEYPQPPPPPTPDLRVRAIEVNQAVQTWRNSVTLYEGKRTAARVFVEQTGATTPAEVDGVLHGRVCSSELEGSPLPSRNGPVPVPEDAAAHEARASFDQNLVFDLPTSWTSASFGCRVELEFEVTSPGELVVECAEYSGPFADPDCIERTGFVEPTRPEMEFVYAPYRHGERLRLDIAATGGRFALQLLDSTTGPMPHDVTEEVLRDELQDLVGTNERRVVIPKPTVDEAAGTRTFDILVRTGENLPRVNVVDLGLEGSATMTVVEQGGQVRQVSNDRMVELVERIRDGLPTDGFDLSFGSMATFDRAPGLANVNIKLSLRRRAKLIGQARQHTEALRSLAYLDGNAVHKNGLAYFKVSSVWENGRAAPTATGSIRNIALHEVVHNYGKAHAVVFSRKDFPVIEIGAWKGLCGSVNTSFEVLGTAVEPIPHPYVERIEGWENEDALTRWGEDWAFTWPTIGPLGDGAEEEVWGLVPRLVDAWDASTGDEATTYEQLAIVDPTRSAELMSYCDPDDGQGTWPSSFTYVRSRLGILKADVGEDAYEFDTEQGYLLVGGSIREDGTAELEPAFQLWGRGGMEPEEGDDLHLALVDATGTELSAVDVASGLDGRHHHEYGPEPFDPHFTAAVPLPEAGEPVALVVSHDGATIARVDASPTAPDVTLTAPTAGELVTGPYLPVTWEMQDTDGDTLATTVQVSPDDGATWETVAVNVPGTAHAVPTAWLARSAEARVRILVTDGFHTTTRTSPSFELAGGTPTVAVTSPTGPVATLPTGRGLTASGWAWDPALGTLADTALTWRSSIDGPVGTGAELRLAPGALTPGCHELALEATGPGGAASDAVLVAVGGAACTAPPAPGTVVVERETPDAPIAAFTSTLPGHASFDLPSTGEVVVTDVPAGPHEVQQLSLGEGWQLEAISCDTPTATTDPVTGVAQFDVAPGEVVACTFTDTTEDTTGGPTAVDDTASGTEDVVLVVDAPGVLANDDDPRGGGLTATLESPPSDGTLTLAPDGGFTYAPETDWCGDDTFTYTATDGTATSAAATVSIAIACVDDPPIVTAVSPPPVAYSDQVAPVTVTATDVDSHPLVLSTDLPADLSSTGGCTAGDDGTACTWTIAGQVLVAAGSHDLGVSVGDATTDVPAGITLTVVREDALVTIVDQPVDVPVDAPGGDSGPFEVDVALRELTPDLPEGLGLPGDLATAGVEVVLEPLAAGSALTGACTLGAPTGTGYDQVRPGTCAFDDVPVGAYALIARATGSHWTGGTEDVVVVSDPSLGFATGGGWFLWPDTATAGHAGDRTSFGFTMSYNRKGTNLRGHLLVVRHLADGTTHRLRSNALDGLAIGDTTASFSGRATHQGPLDPEPEGNHDFVVVVEDGGTPGAEVDRFWVQVRDRDGVATPLWLPGPAADGAAVLSGGNISVPHQTKGGGRLP